MSSETIWNRVRRSPFKPFRLNTSDGKHFDINHPEMITLSKNQVIVYLFERGEVPGQDLASREAFISPLHVTSVEDVPRRQTNGSRRRA